MLLIPMLKFTIKDHKIFNFETGIIGKIIDSFANTLFKFF